MTGSHPHPGDGHSSRAGHACCRHSTAGCRRPAGAAPAMLRRHTWPGQYQGCSTVPFNWMLLGDRDKSADLGTCGQAGGCACCSHRTAGWRSSAGAAPAALTWHAWSTQPQRTWQAALAFCCLLGSLQSHLERECLIGRHARARHIIASHGSEPWLDCTTFLDAQSLNTTSSAGGTGD